MFKSYGIYQRGLKMKNNRFNKIRKRLRQFFDLRTLSSKILLTIIVISITLPITISLFLIEYTEQTINQYVTARNENTVKQAKENIEIYLSSPINAGKILSFSNSVEESNFLQMQKLFRNVLQNYPIIKDIRTYRSADAKYIFGTSTDDSQSFLKDSIVLKKINNLKEYTSSFYLDESKQPLINVYYPVIKFGLPIYILEIKIDLKFIWELIDNIKIQGQYGNAFLLSETSKVIAHKDKDLVYNGSVISTFFNMREKIGTKPYFDENNELIVGTYAIIDQLNWLLVIEQKQEEANQLVDVMRRSMLLFIFIAAFLSFIIGVFVVRRISKPIEELIHGVKQYSEGHLQHTIILNSNDELEDLADEFNHMSRKLYYNQKKLRRVERIAAMNKFVRMVSHEIRNPLNSMNINMQILKREINKADGVLEKKNKYFDILSSEIKRMDDLISNYMLLAQAPKLDFILIDIHQILNEVILIYQGQANQEGIEILAKYDSKAISAQVDINQFKTGLY
jgi:nitrogen fixation/metabolism regulation signal transduction histidine kinase